MGPDFRCSQVSPGALALSSLGMHRGGVPGKSPFSLEGKCGTELPSLYLGERDWRRCACRVSWGLHGLPPGGPAEGGEVGHRQCPDRLRAGLSCCDQVQTVTVFDKGSKLFRGEHFVLT